MSPPRSLRRPLPSDTPGEQLPKPWRGSGTFPGQHELGQKLACGRGPWCLVLAGRRSRAVALPRGPGLQSEPCCVTAGQALSQQAGSPPVQLVNLFLPPRHSRWIPPKSVPTSLSFPGQEPCGALGVLFLGTRGVGEVALRPEEGEAGRGRALKGLALPQGRPQAGPGSPEPGWRC